MNADPSTKVCPQCSADLSSTDAAGVTECPQCHAALPSATNTKITGKHWPLFWVLFLSPPVFCVLFGLAKLTELSAVLVMIGLACGIVCGTLLAKIIGKPKMAFILVPVLMLVELVLCIFGCVASLPASSFH